MNRTSRRLIVAAKVLAVFLLVEFAGWLAVPSWSIMANGITRATPEQIWSWFADTKDWPNWDHLVDRVDATGPFVASAETINTTGGLALRSKLVEVTDNVRYREVISMPLATLTATHELTPTADGTRTIHGIKVSGTGAWLFYVVKHAALQEGMNDAMRRLTANAVTGLPIHRLP